MVNYQMSNYNLCLFRKNYNNLLITNSLYTIVIAYARKLIKMVIMKLQCSK